MGNAKFRRPFAIITITFLFGASAALPSRQAQTRPSTSPATLGTDGRVAMVVKELLKEAGKHLPAPDHYASTSAYSEIAEVYGHLGDSAESAKNFSLARRANAEILGLGIEGAEYENQALAFEEIAKAQARAGDKKGAVQSIADARAALSKIRFPPGTRPTPDWPFPYSLMDVSMLAAAQAEAGDPNGAEVTLRLLEVKGPPEPGSYEATLKFVGLLSIVEAHAKSGNVARALASAERGPGVEDGDRLRRAIVSIQAGSGRIEQARGTLKQIRSAGPRADALADITESQSAAGDANGAKATFDLIPHDEITARSRAVRAVVMAKAKSKDIAGATALANSVAEEDVCEAAFVQIALLQAEAGDIPAALATAKRCKDDLNRAEVLATVAAAQARAGDIDAAMLSAQETMPISFWRDRAVVMIAEVYARAGQAERSINALRRGVPDDDHFRDLCIETAAELTKR